MTETPKTLILEHDCQKTMRPVVILQTALDPSYWVGACPLCKETIYRKKAEI